jgi:hypothetical protein
MRKVLICVACKQEISKPVTICTVDETSPLQPVETYGEPMCSEGVALMLVSEELQYQDSNFSIPQYVLNLNDILKTIKLTKNLGRLNGCCGFDGCDGPNRICTCGAEVGTQRDDCWMPARFVPEGHATSWRDSR